MFKARILADSISPRNVRLTTFECTYPRIIHAEIMTHRAFSRNTASSRAIPIEKMIEKVMDNPFIPIHWGKNQKGMQAFEELLPEEAMECEKHWLLARDAAAKHAKAMSDIGIHKQIANRLLEPFLWHTAIISATDWDNFYTLRCHKDAEYHIQKIAHLMRSEQALYSPKPIGYDEYHLPLMTNDDVNLPTSAKIKVSIGRCARVSYLTHDGKRSVEADIALYSKLKEDKHLSPFEHVAKPIRWLDEAINGSGGNFRGWRQARAIETSW